MSAVILFEGKNSRVVFTDEDTQSGIALRYRQNLIEDGGASSMQLVLFSSSIYPSHAP
jgi:hypothetical protein